MKFKAQELTSQLRDNTSYIFTNNTLNKLKVNCKHTLSGYLQGRRAWQKKKIFWSYTQNKMIQTKFKPNWLGQCLHTKQLDTYLYTYQSLKAPKDNQWHKEHYCNLTYSILKPSKC